MIKVRLFFFSEKYARLNFSNFITRDCKQNLNSLIQYSPSSRKIFPEEARRDFLFKKTQHLEVSKDLKMTYGVRENILGLRLKLKMRQQLLQKILSTFLLGLIKLFRGQHFFLLNNEPVF